MNHNKKFNGYWVLLLLASFILLNGCKSIELASKWRDIDITIDAIDNEWQDNKPYYDKKTDTSIGVYNDNSYVYMCLSTKDIEIQTAIVQQGFIVWLNGDGSKAKQLGIRFPVVEEGDRSGAPPGGGAPPGQGGPGGSVQASLAELKILTSKKDEGTTFTHDDAEKMGISASMRNLNNELIYELKVPLKKTDQSPYAVVPSELNVIGAGFMLYGTSRSASGISGFGGSMSDMSSGGGMGGGPPGGGMDSRDGSFSARDISSMSDIFNFFGMSDDDTSSMSYEDVSIINAQPGGGGPPPGGGMGGGMGDMDSGMGDMGGGMGGAPTTTFNVWFKITLATK